jgi:hypothetical protein
MLLVELKAIIDSLDAETLLVSGKIMAGRRINVKSITAGQRVIYDPM